MKKIIDSLKYIKLKDLIAPFIFLLMLIPSLIFRLINKVKKRQLWLVCENGETARDNGYHFYKYVRTNHKNDYCFYVIDKNKQDYKKVEKYGNIIQFKGLKHWLYYLAADYNISSQKNGNPNQPLFYVVHVSLNMFNNRVFLQHGVIKDMCDWLIYKNTKFKYFICGAKQEHKYVSEKYGYPTGSVIYTGLPRFDNLHNSKVNEKQILIMPTWRSWLGRETNDLTKKINFKDTDFYKNWNGLLNDKKFIDYIEKNNYTVLFYPHINMQKYLNEFEIKSNKIKLINTTTDIQKVLKESALMITDYSSVFMDFAYMEKPIIYFQFDYEEFRKKQYSEGYFDYKKNIFGKSIENIDGVVKEIKKISKDGIAKENLNNMREFFELKDKNNCKRIYETIKENK